MLIARQAQAADIETFDQARDRFLSEVTYGRKDALAVYGGEVRLQGPVAVTMADGEAYLGEGAGWLFAVKIKAALSDLYIAAFVNQDAKVATKLVKALPVGLAPLSDKKSNAIPGAVKSQDKAYARLLDGLLGHSALGRRIYTAGRTDAAEVSIKSWRGDVVLTGGPGWVFFVDDNPRANWTHACRYVLVSEDGTLTVIDAKTPPDDMSVFTELTAWSEPSAAKNAVLTENVVTRPSPVTPAATPAVNRYAVIISGGWNRFSNYPRYWNDCAYFYNTLMSYGFLKENITVLFADGTDPAVDRPDSTSSPTDFDGDGLPDINYSATKANLTTVFNALSAQLTSDDVLYIFTTDHGSYQTGNDAPYATPNVTLCLWGEEITGDEFAAEVNKVTAKAIAAIFEQCFSGGLVEKLKAANRVLMSAARWWELSYAAVSIDYDEFSYYATKALAEPALGDSNGDGVVTMEEAYLYALANDSYQEETISGGDNDGEHPSYYSNPWSLGRNLSLGGQGVHSPPLQAGFIQKELSEAYPTLGIAQGWNADDGLWSLSLPFSFPWDGTDYTSASVSSNGIIYFNSSDLGSANKINLLKSGRAIAPLWDDLTTAPSGCDIHVASNSAYVDVAWVAKTVIDARPVNMTARLYPSGQVTFYYGTGNEHTSRVEKRDKTIGLSTSSQYALALRNGASDLGSAAPLAFVLPSSMNVPALSGLGAVIFTALLALSGGFVLRRRKGRNPPCPDTNDRTNNSVP
jgi:hypothetical protein